MRDFLREDDSWKWLQWQQRRNNVRNYIFAMLRESITIMLLQGITICWCRASPSCWCWALQPSCWSRESPSCWCRASPSCWCGASPSCWCRVSPSCWCRASDDGERLLTHRILTHIKFIQCNQLNKLDMFRKYWKILYIHFSSSSGRISTWKDERIL